MLEASACQPLLLQALPTHPHGTAMYLPLPGLNEHVSPNLTAAFITSCLGGEQTPEGTVQAE